MPRHTNRLAQGVDRVATFKRDSFPMNFISATAVELHISGKSDDIRARLAERLANIQGFELGQLVDMVQSSLSNLR